jgi:hypothetical protein
MGSLVGATPTFAYDSLHTAFLVGGKWLSKIGGHLRRAFAHNNHWLHEDVVPKDIEDIVENKTFKEYIDQFILLEDKVSESSLRVRSRNRGEFPAEFYKSTDGLVDQEPNTVLFDTAGLWRIFRILCSRLSKDDLRRFERCLDGAAEAIAALYLAGRVGEQSKAFIREKLDVMTPHRMLDKYAKVARLMLFIAMQMRGMRETSESSRVPGLNHYTEFHCWRRKSTLFILIEGCLCIVSEGCFQEWIDASAYIRGCDVSYFVCGEGADKFRFEVQMEIALTEFINKLARINDPLEAVLISRRAHLAWFASFSCLDASLSPDPRLLVGPSYLDLDKGQILESSISSEVNLLRKRRSVVGLFQGEAIAKIYHCTPGIMTYPSPFHEGEANHATKDPSSDAILEAVWCRLYAAAASLGDNIIRALDLSESRVRSATRNAVFERWRRDICCLDTSDIEELITHHSQVHHFDPTYDDVRARKLTPEEMALKGYWLFRSILENRKTKEAPVLQSQVPKRQLKVTRRRYGDKKVKNIKAAFGKSDVNEEGKEESENIDTPSVWVEMQMLPGNRPQLEKKSSQEIFYMSLAPTPLAGMNYAYLFPHIGCNTSRHVDIEEGAERARLPREYENTFLHSWMLGPDLLTLKHGRLKWRQTIPKILKGEYIGRRPLIISQKVEQKLVSAKGGARPTYSGSWSMRQVQRAVTSPCVSVCRRMKHIAPVYSAASMEALVAGTVSLDADKYVSRHLNSDISGWSPKFKRSWRVRYMAGQLGCLQTPITRKVYKEHFKRFTVIFRYRNFRREIDECGTATEGIPMGFQPA